MIETPPSPERPAVAPNGPEKAEPARISPPPAKPLEYFWRLVVVGFGVLAGFIVAFIVALAVGWIPFIC